jgi:hypothetical protein
MNQQTLEQITAIVATLPELRKQSTGPVDPYHQAIAQVGDLVGLKRAGGVDWNATIDWLDSAHPGWRGVPNPQRIKNSVLARLR